MILPSVPILFPQRPGCEREFSEGAQPAQEKRFRILRVHVLLLFLGSLEEVGGFRAEHVVGGFLDCHVGSFSLSGTSGF